MTERDIINGCIKNDATCQRLLFEQYAGRLLTICLRYASDRPEAEDMLQEAFIKIFSRIHQYTWEGSFEGWMKRIVVNCALRALQKRKLRFSELESIDNAAPQSGAYALSNLSEEELLKLISRLPDGYRIVFNLYVMEGFSHDEIGAMLGIEAATSRSQLVKARRMLQQQILTNEKIAI